MNKKILVLVLFCYSCGKSNDEQKNFEDKIKIEFVKNVDLTVDEKTPNWSSNSHYFIDENKNEFICSLNTPANSLQIYNLDGKKVKESKFDMEGPNATGAIQGFLYKNRDSIYIFNYNRLRIYRVSMEGKVHQTYQLPFFSNDSYYSVPWAEDGTDMYLYNKYLYIPSSSGLDYYKNRKEFYKQGKINIKLDLTNSSSINQITYPNIDYLIDKDYTNILVAPKCIPNTDNKQLIYSFGADHNVYNYDLSGRMVGKHLFKSRYAKDDIETLESKDDFNDPIKQSIYYLNNLSYSKLYYDKYRKLYYRLVKHAATPEYTLSDFKSGKRPELNFSLIIADLNFNILGEIMLKKGQGIGTFLVTKDGVLIRDVSFQNENIMRFVEYKVVKY